MKAYSATMIIGIIIAVIIGVAVLYLFWTRAMTPFTKATSKTVEECNMYQQDDCMKFLQTIGGTQPDFNVFQNLKGCESHITDKNKKDAFLCCVYNINCKNQKDSCKILCGIPIEITPTKQSTTTTKSKLSSCSNIGGTCIAEKMCRKMGGSCQSSSDCSRCCCVSR